LEDIYEIAVEDTKDEKYLNLRSTVRKDQKKYPDLRVDGDLIYKYIPAKKANQDRDFEWKLYVPRDKVAQALHDCHCTPLSPHFGIYKTMKLVRKTYYWPNLGKDVVSFVRECDTCKAIKAPNFVTKLPLRPHAIPRRKFGVIAIDFATDLPRSKNGNTGFLIIVDTLTKFPWAYPMRRTDAETMVEILKQKFMEFGVPSVIISDNGRQFISKVYLEFLEKWGITAQKTPFYHPQANPAERVIRGLKTGIRAFASDNQKAWDTHLQEFLAGARSVEHESTGFSPYFAAFGQEMYLTGKYQPYSADPEAKTVDKETLKNSSDRIVKEARERCQKAQKQWKAYYDKSTKMVKYQPGDMVFRKNFKQSNKLQGYNAKLGKKYVKCKVLKDLGDGSYELEEENGKPGVYHSDDLVPASKIRTRRKDTNQVGEIRSTTIPDEIPNETVSNPDDKPPDKTVKPKRTGG
jgi:transposase InsO family protein